MIYLAEFFAQGKLENQKSGHVLGRSLLGSALEKEYRLRPGSWRVSTGPGKPFLETHPHLHFNISHSHGLAAVALGFKPLGLDVERIKPFRQVLLGKVLSNREQEDWEKRGQKGQEAWPWFFRYWTLKESYVKATGDGLSYPFRQVEFWWDRDGRICCSKPGYEFYQAVLSGTYVISLCIQSAKEETGSKQWARQATAIDYSEPFEIGKHNKLTTHMK